MRRIRCVSVVAMPRSIVRSDSISSRVSVVGVTTSVRSSPSRRLARGPFENLDATPQIYDRTGEAGVAIDQGRDDTDELGDAPLEPLEAGVGLADTTVGLLDLREQSRSPSSRRV